MLGFHPVSAAPVSALVPVAKPAPPPPPPPPPPVPSGTEGGGAGFGGAPPPYRNFAPIIPGPNDNTFGLSGLDAYQQQLDDFYRDFKALAKKRKKRRDAIREKLKAAWRKRQEEEAEELWLLLGFDLSLVEDEAEQAWTLN